VLRPPPSSCASVYPLLLKPSSDLFTSLSLVPHIFIRHSSILCNTLAVRRFHAQHRQREHSQKPTSFRDAPPSSGAGRANRSGRSPPEDGSHHDHHDTSHHDTRTLAAVGSTQRSEGAGGGGGVNGSCGDGTRVDAASVASTDDGEGAVDGTAVEGGYTVGSNGSAGGTTLDAGPAGAMGRGGAPSSYGEQFGELK
jgi:hypothetical protein